MEEQAASWWRASLWWESWWAAAPELWWESWWAAAVLWWESLWAAFVAPSWSVKSSEPLTSASSL